MAKGRFLGFQAILRMGGGAEMAQGVRQGWRRVALVGREAAANPGPNRSQFRFGQFHPRPSAQFLHMG